MTRQSRYRYDAEHRRAALQERYFTGFMGLLFRAHQGNAKPLCDYLRSDQHLSTEDREGLAWLMDKKMQAPPLGRRPGRVRSPIIDSAWEIYDEVCRRREAERSMDGRQRLPKGRLPKLVEEVIAERKQAAGSRSRSLPTADYVLSLFRR